MQIYICSISLPLYFLPLPHSANQLISFRCSSLFPSHFSPLYHSLSPLPTLSSSLPVPLYHPFSITILAPTFSITFSAVICECNTHLYSLILKLSPSFHLIFSHSITQNHFPLPWSTSLIPFPSPLHPSTLSHPLSLPSTSLLWLLLFPSLTYPLPLFPIPIHTLSQSTPLCPLYHSVLHSLPCWHLPYSFLFSPHLCTVAFSLPHSFITPFLCLPPHFPLWHLCSMPSPSFPLGYLCSLPSPSFPLGYLCSLPSPSFQIWHLCFLPLPSFPLGYICSLPSPSFFLSVFTHTFALSLSPWHLIYAFFLICSVLTLTHLPSAFFFLIPSLSMSMFLNLCSLPSPPSSLSLPPYPRIF